MIVLHASCPLKNIDRIYIINWGHTLFEDVFLRVQWGRRTNKKLCEKTYFFETINQLERTLKSILRKRFTSYKRLGVSYRLIKNEGIKL